MGLGKKPFSGNPKLSNGSFLYSQTKLYNSLCSSVRQTFLFFNEARCFNFEILADSLHPWLEQISNAKYSFVEFNHHWVSPSLQSRASTHFTTKISHNCQNKNCKQTPLGGIGEDGGEKTNYKKQHSCRKESTPLSNGMKRGIRKKVFVLFLSVIKYFFFGFIKLKW